MSKDERRLRGRELAQGYFDENVPDAWREISTDLAELTEKQIRRGSHRSSRALEDAIRVYLATTNEHPKPFVWVKTAHDILASIARFALRTSETGH